MARVPRKWRRSSENGAGPVKMARVTSSDARVKSSEARVTSSEINCPVLIFKIAAILTKILQLFGQISSHSVETLRALNLKLTDIN